MSEYQYYEFQALERPLTQEQVAQLRDVSSRARITPQSFVNEYNFGSFKGSPDRWMERYFDAFLYFANWRSRRFMLRLPLKLPDSDAVETYCAGESLSCERKKNCIVLSFDAELGDLQWDEEDISLASLIPIRADLMRGDCRAPYLGWLLALQCQELDEDELEPALPPGLGDLSGSLDCLANFLGMDPDLIAAAAESSADGQLPTPSKNQIEKWVRSLPSADKEEITTRLVDGDDPHIAAEIRQRPVSEITAASGRSGEGPRRTADEIVACAETIASERKKREAEARAKEKAKRERAEAEARRKYLESLVGKQNDLWSKVDKLIATK